MPPAPKATRSKSKGRNENLETQNDDSNVASTDSASTTTTTVVVTTAPIIAVTANISAITTAVTAVSTAQVAVTVVSSAITTVSDMTTVTTSVTSGDMTNVISSAHSVELSSHTTEPTIAATTVVTASSSMAPIMSAVISSDQNEYDVSGLSSSMLAAWNLCSKEEKDTIEFLRGNLEYIRSEKRGEFLTNYLEKGKIQLYVFAILSQMATGLAATHSEILSIRGEDYNPQLTDCEDGSELGAVGGSIPQPAIQPTQQISEVGPITAQIASINTADPEAYARVLGKLNNSTSEQRLQTCSNALCDGIISLSQYDRLMVIAQHMSL